MKQASFTKKLLRVFGKTNAKYKLIREGDRVLVALSGGKDSLTMVHLISNLKRHAPFSFDFLACTISYGMEGEDYTFLKEHCKEYNIPYVVYETNIFEVANDTIRENSSYCSYFSRMRRGALYSFAQKEGFNKVALGHHFDDAVESFFMNLFYNGALRSMAPIYKSKYDIDVIRPLILAREEQLRNFVRSNNFITIGDEACPAMLKPIKPPYVREKTKNWLREMEKDNPDLFKRIKAAFSNIHDDSFLDPNRLKRGDEKR
ncbi:MAG: tRNA 2-thiocytidine biosynthesis protein TtcA [Epsilonproteobacteria bacterium]|nr:tRNA 2-thiocytidine biosynthesis protein TtcA [Campylobacterota bacterium]